MYSLSVNKIREIVIFLYMIIFSGTIFSQTLNFGLSQKQNVSDLPHSEFSFQKVQRKERSFIKGELEKINGWECKLSKGWRLIEAEKVALNSASIFSSSFDNLDWYNATVPGTVLTTLVDQGVYADPFWGLNNLTIPDSLCRMDWIYRNDFTIPSSNKGKRIKLIFNGINYKAEIWLNNKYVGKITGSFARGQFDITDIAKIGGHNILAVRIIPPANPGIPHEANKYGIGPNGGVMCLDGPTFISSEGWDWIPGIRDRNIGIWQDVVIRYANDAEIIDPQVITDLPLPDTTSVSFIIRSKIRNMSNLPLETELRFTIGDISASYPLSLLPHEVKEVKLDKSTCNNLVMKNPKLWWPNGYGNQFLYNASISLLSDKRDTLDVRTMRIGIREMEYELTANITKSDFKRLNYNPVAAQRDGMPTFDNIKRVKTSKGIYIPHLLDNISSDGITCIDDTLMNQHIVIKVNGQRIYCKGGNWGMDDGMKRCSHDYLEPFMKLHKSMNYNMVRNWTGESTEEAFFDLCDQYGMLVFNDFWLSTEGFNLNVLDNNLFIDNVREVICRYRNHPSIALWCARNEGFAPDELEKRLEYLIAAEDGTRHYLGSSRLLNSATSGPWHYQNPKWYYTSLAGGFKSEVGTPSLPKARTVREFMAKEDVWPINDVWYYHDWHNRSFGEKTFSEIYKDAIDQKYGESDNIDDFCKKAQLINYDSHRAIFEAWNSKMWNDASGVLLWMSHPAWPSMVWQNYSSNGDTGGAYYGAQKACKPIHVQMSLDKYHIDVINATLKEINNVQIIISVCDKNGKKVDSYAVKIDKVKANAKTQVSVIDRLDKYPDFCWIKLDLLSKGKFIDDNVYCINMKEWNGKIFSEIPQANIKVEIKSFRKVADKYIGKLSVKNIGTSVAMAVEMSLTETSSGKRILPVYFDDGLFTLLPNDDKIVSFYMDCKDDIGGKSLCIDGYNIERQEIPL